MDTINDLIMAHSFSEAGFWSIHTPLWLSRYIVCLLDDERITELMATFDLQIFLLNRAILYHCLDTSTARSIISLLSTRVDSQRVKKRDCNIQRVRAPRAALDPA